MIDFKQAHTLDSRLDVKSQYQEAAKKFKESKKKDYYHILGVPRSASEKEIKKAYQQMVKKNHPDKITDPNEKEQATKRFQDIKEAYDVLSDPKKKQRFDSGADDEGMDIEFDGFPGGGAANFEFGDLGQIFQMFSGRGGNGGGNFKFTTFTQGGGSPDGFGSFGDFGGFGGFGGAESPFAHFFQGQNGAGK